jgi:hypothetical protein
MGEMEIVISRPVRISCILGSILIIIGWFTPYFYGLIMGYPTYQWMWGLISSMGVTTMLPLVGDVLTMFILAIIILILVIINVIICLLMKRLKDKRLMAILSIIIGVIIIILVILPPIITPAVLTVYTLYVGFYLMLIGAIMKIIYGIYVLRLI